MSIEAMTLLDAAKAVVERWDSPNWKDLPSTGVYINALRQAIEKEQSNLERLVRIMGTFDLATGHADSMDEALDSLESELRDVLGHLRNYAKTDKTDGALHKEWVGLTDEEIWQIHEDFSTNQLWDSWNYERVIESKLREKNT
jgi:NTP pyrophosphatase (non-canonical NTP hydrolase)